MALALLGAVTDNEHDGLYATSRWGVLTRGIQPASFSYRAYPLLPRRLDQGCTGSMGKPSAKARGPRGVNG